jgi:hypothetical protein
MAMDTAFWDKDLTYQDGEVLETEKFFLLIIISNDKNQEEDGKQ